MNAANQRHNNSSLVSWFIRLWKMRLALKRFELEAGWSGGWSSKAWHAWVFVDRWHWDQWWGSSQQHWGFCFFWSCGKVSKSSFVSETLKWWNSQINKPILSVVIENNPVSIHNKESQHQMCEVLDQNEGSKLFKVLKWFSNCYNLD